ncbi:MAG: helix-turn-helix transcriptional regulator [Hyphomonadaceae bacterium]|nr:helix-turn-helix transcriptional regulator [Clostridia bacterium]
MNLREIRMQKRMTQRVLARRASVTQAYISQIENNIKQNVGVIVLKRIASALGVDAAMLMMDNTLA